MTAPEPEVSPPLISCVIYGAKSSADLRGSIPEQLRDCREAIETTGDRVVVAEYADERFSGFTRDRGPGLADALQHVEDLAQEGGSVELWAQHSDRLARGDGLQARHTVEIALWAIKLEVSVRCVQDPDTFSNLLYAVVTGQRNHEDSRRKGLAMAAGRRRAAERGDFIGYLPDGYKVVAEIDARGRAKKRMVIDPERQEVIETIFRMGLRGRTSGQIAYKLNDCGWLTSPRRKDIRPARWANKSVRVILANPRYAGLQVFGGKIAGTGHWPTYITERQHHRLQARRPANGPAKGTKPLRRETYLLAGLMTCGRCGQALYCETTFRRSDGSYSRRYVCASHDKDRHADRCDAPRIAADQLEAMMVASLRMLLIESSNVADADAEPTLVFDLAWEQQRLRTASSDGESQFQAAVADLMARRARVDVAVESSLPQRQKRQLAALSRFETWAAEELHERTAQTRATAIQLNRVLKTWFTDVTVDVTPIDVTIHATRRYPTDAPPQLRQTSTHMDRVDWTRVACLVNRRRFRCSAWDEAEILGAMQAWAQLNGRSPTYADWTRGHGAWPAARTVLRHFPVWDNALLQAGLQPYLPSARPRNHPWTDHDILWALQRWSREHGRRPTWDDWIKAAPDRPCTWTVEKHFGGWRAGLIAAGLS